MTDSREIYILVLVFLCLFSLKRYHLLQKILQQWNATNSSNAKSTVRIVLKLQ